MNDSDDFVSPQRVRTAQIIAGALIMGLVSFGAIAVAIQIMQKPLPGQAQFTRMPIISYVAFYLFVIQVPLSFFIPQIVTRTTVAKLVKTGDKVQASPSSNLSDLLWAIFQSSLIIGLAMLDGAGFFAGIAYLLEGLPGVLVILAAVVLMMLLRFPTSNRVQAWMVQQADLMEQLRQ
jgi:hypothetical protein